MNPTALAEAPRFEKIFVFLYQMKAITIAEKNNIGETVKRRFQGSAI